VRDSEQTIKMEHQKWYEKYHKQEDHFIICNKCAEIFQNFNQIIKFIKHLRSTHNIIELDNHPKSKILKDKFIIMKQQGYVKCKKCAQKIQFDHGVWRLENHLRICQPDATYSRINILFMGQNIWKKYIIKNQKMICSKCETFEVENETMSQDKLLELLLSHYHCRHMHTRYVKKYLYLIFFRQ